MYQNGNIFKKNKRDTHIGRTQLQIKGRHSSGHTTPR